LIVFSIRFPNPVQISAPRASDKTCGRSLADAGAPMTKRMQKPIRYVILSDRDQWAVEAEWPDGTLERIDRFADRSSATDWMSTRSDAWLRARRTPNTRSSGANLAGGGSKNKTRDRRG
jgi:hypothetical protein